MAPIAPGIAVPDAVALTPDRRDHGALVRALSSWLQARLPGADIDIPPPRKPLAGGSSETYFLTPRITRDGVSQEERWVLRIQATENQIYQNPAVERQYRVMDAIGRLGAAPVPDMLWFEPDAAVLGSPFFLMSCVDGDIPSDFIHSKGLLPALAEGERHALWTSAIAAMANVHRADPAQFPFLVSEESGGSGLGAEIAAWDAYSRWTSAVLRPIQIKARLWLEDHLPNHRPTGLAWGDARLGNMVFRDTSCVAILDWETASLGGAETDLGWWIFYDWMMTDGMEIERLPGIGGRDALLSTWASFAGREARDMDWHEMFATWRYSLISDHARHLARLRDPTGPIASNRKSLAADRLEMLLAR